MWKYILGVVLGVTLLGYSLIGTAHHVDNIVAVAPVTLEQRGFSIIRYDGFQYGSWSRHGGKVWYYVKDKTNPSIRYKVSISSWNGELQFYYDEPEKLQQLDITAKL